MLRFRSPGKPDAKPPPDSGGRTFADRGAAWAYACGLSTRIIRVRREVLTVLCYHRIEEFAPGRFQGFHETISASPEAFERHLEYLCDHFTPISVSELAGFIR